MASDDDAATTASDALVATIAGPAEMTGDAGSVRTQPIPDLIAADQYLAAKAAASNGRRGLRFTRLVPPGTAGDC